MLLTVFDIIIAGVISGGIYALVAAGFNLQYGVARILNVAHGEFIMLGALATYSLYATLHINPLISLVICGPIILIIAVAIHTLVFPRLSKASETIEIFEGKSLLACFGIMFIIQNAALLIWGADRRGYDFLASPVNIFGAIFAENRLMTLLFSIVLGLALYFFLTRTRLGKAIRAVTQDGTAAQLMGIPTGVMQGLSFGLGALLAGLSGVLISTMLVVTPFIGMDYTVIAIIVVVLGGLGNILGSMVGGIILGIVGSLTTFFNPALSLVAYYIIFVILILVKPEGVFSRR
jgi:branched-chain amino acid transport system permease protein